MSSGARAKLIFAPGAPVSGVRKNDAGVLLDIAMPLQSGPEVETVLEGDSVRQSGAFYLVENGTTLAGAAIAPVGISPRKSASLLYDELFGIIGDRHLWRVWNYIPGINDVVDGEENYREFNAGRLASFQGNYGADFRSRLSAASALGTRGGAFAFAFIAGQEKPVHFENPEQVPACDYPADYGPLPPAFARGTRVGDQWFLAGTASIKGHNTLGDTCAEQMRLTLDNIRVMERTMSLPSQRDSAWKVFVRHESDIATCREMFAAAYPDAAAKTMFLHADICRSGLLVEIEAVFSA